MENEEKKKRSFSFSAFFALPLLILFAVTAVPVTPVYAKTEKTLTKTYTFKSDTSSNFNYPAKKEIKEDGKTYELKDISYKVKKTYKPVKREAEFTGLTSKTLPKTRTYKVDGKETKLTLKKGSATYKKHQRKIKGRTYSRTYNSTTSRTGVTRRPDFPKTITMTRDGRNLKGRLVNVTSTSSTVPFTVTGTFTTNDRASNNYFFNNRRIRLTGNGPSFSGYESTILTALGLDSDVYTIRSAAWRTGFYRSGSGYARDCTFSGTRRVSDYTAHYRARYQRRTKTRTLPATYSAKATYTNGVEKESDVVSAICSYEKKGPDLLPIIVSAAAGCFLAALLFVLIMYIISKKRGQPFLFSGKTESTKADSKKTLYLK